MIPEHNMKPIKNGDTWAYTLEFFSDPYYSTPMDVSSYDFKLMAKDSSGATIFTWNNAIFVQGSGTNVRTVTLSNTTTAGYTVGEFRYELQATKPDGVYTLMQGYIKVYDQTTS
jgi:hypothetical protein